MILGILYVVVAYIVTFWLLCRDSAQYKLFKCGTRWAVRAGETGLLLALAPVSMPAICMWMYFTKMRPPCDCPCRCHDQRFMRNKRYAPHAHCGECARELLDTADAEHIAELATYKSREHKLIEQLSIYRAFVQDANTAISHHPAGWIPRSEEPLEDQLCDLTAALKKHAAHYEITRTDLTEANKLCTAYSKQILTLEQLLVRCAMSPPFPLLETAAAGHQQEFLTQLRQIIDNRTKDRPTLAKMMKGRKREPTGIYTQSTVTGAVAGARPPTPDVVAAAGRNNWQLQMPGMPPDAADLAPETAT